MSILKAWKNIQLSLNVQKPVQNSLGSRYYTDDWVDSKIRIHMIKFALPMILFTFFPSVFAKNNPCQYNTHKNRKIFKTLYDSTPMRRLAQIRIQKKNFHMILIRTFPSVFKKNPCQYNSHEKSRNVQKMTIQYRWRVKSKIRTRMINVIFSYDFIHCPPICPILVDITST